MDILSGFQVVLEGLLFSGILAISRCLGQGHLSGDVYGYPPTSERRTLPGVHAPALHVLWRYKHPPPGHGMDS